MAAKVLSIHPCPGHPRYDCHSLAIQILPRATACLTVKKLKKLISFSKESAKSVTDFQPLKLELMALAPAEEQNA